MNAGKLERQVNFDIDSVEPATYWFHAFYSGFPNSAKVDVLPKSYCFATNFRRILQECERISKHDSYQHEYECLRN